MKRLAFAALLGLLACIAIAQTVSTSVALAWSAPTTNTDGTTIAGALTYNLYQGPVAGPFVKVASGLTGTSDTITSLTAGNCFALSAVEVQGATGATSVESALTTTKCVEVPGAPGNMTISVTLTVK
jgi:hypothetical protein